MCVRESVFNSVRVRICERERVCEYMCVSVCERECVSVCVSCECVCERV